jgi:hypothetical protein
MELSACMDEGDSVWLGTAAWMISAGLNLLI